MGIIYLRNFLERLRQHKHTILMKTIQTNKLTDRKIEKNVYDVTQ